MSGPVAQGGRPLETARVFTGITMTKKTLTPALVKSTMCPTDKRRVDIYDEKTKGLILEIRPTGGKTYYLRYTDARGRTRQHKLADERDVTLAQARQLADSTRNQIAMGSDPLNKKSELRGTPTVDRFFYDRYLPYAKGYKRSWDTDESLYRNHISQRIGKLKLDEVTKDDVIKMLHSRRAEGAAKGSANRLVVLTCYMFNLALKWETPAITKNPASGIQMFDDPPMKERFLSPQEAQRLLESVQHSENPMLQYIIPMLILTGARRSEVLHAKWKDIDVANLSWRIPITKNGRPRHVPLSDSVIRLLKLIPFDQNCPYIFANPKTKKPFVSIYHSWHAARTAVGLADVRLHDLRHSFASFLVNNGRSIYEVQKILGHTQIKTTQRYAHLSNDTLLDAANIVATSVGPLMSDRTLAAESELRLLTS